ncbi:hypothetical protein FB451DRAFT_1238812 [Mycena latifolia]|nr:hypothetical protein FB451DRAFT_1238812 [Mycena latifolia]
MNASIDSAKLNAQVLYFLHCFRAMLMYLPHCVSARRLVHQQKRTSLADLAPDEPRAPYRQNLIWRHNDTSFLNPRRNSTAIRTYRTCCGITQSARSGCSVLVSFPLGECSSSTWTLRREYWHPPCWQFSRTYENMTLPELTLRLTPAAALVISSDLNRSEVNAVS